MSVYKRGKVYWYEFVFRGERYRASTGCTSKAQAREVEQRERERVRRVAVAGIDDAVTLGDALATWFRDHAQHLKSARTIAFQLDVLARVMDMNAPVSAIDESAIAQAMQARRGEVTHNKRPPAPSTVNREILDTLRPALRHAKRVLRADVQDIDWRSLRLKERTRHYDFTEQERAAVADALPEHHRLILAFLARYGTRLKEAWFPLSAFDGARLLLRERKGGQPHIIPLLASDQEWIAQRVETAREHGLAHIWFRDDLTPIPPATFQTAMKRAYRKVGIKGARAAHEWRHYAGTAFLGATGDLAATQRLLGHADIGTTRRYAQPADAAVMAGLEKLASPHKNPHNED